VAGFENDPQSERWSDCPKNYLGIVDFEVLTKIERVFVHKRLRELSATKSKGKFDALHLRTIHRFIFQDVFPWAGEFRVVDISKGSSPFAWAMHIGSALDELLARLGKEELLAGLDRKIFAARAHYLS
jgi:cell filamentation protein